MSPRASQPTRKKILIWSRDRSQFEELSDWLSAAAYEVVVYPDVHDIVAVCAAELPDLIVMDSRDAGVMDRIDEDKKFRRTPVLLISDCNDPPAGVACSRACVTDWLPVPVREEELILKARAILRVAYTDSLTSEPSERDGLTKLYNRRYFDERLEREIERARRYGRKLTCVMMDIDGFSELNERHGHRAGDRMLSGLGDILLSGTRCSDIIARYGGQEFALLLPETGGNDARTMAERIRKAFWEKTVECDGQTMNATMSCGVASYPDHARDAETLVRMANSAIFQ
ncbi:MAG: diguanylate cyclase, partial [Candidatus Eisenbacteria bacterium]|nr:diguanylate cyclase [Candidatus Eisenbacteria bacterium]